MYRIAGAVVHRAINARCMNLRAQAPMNKPLLKPDGLERSGCDLAKQRGNMWPTKSAEAILRRVSHIRVAVVKRCARAGEDQEAMKAVSYTHLRAHETPEHLVCR